MPATTTTFAYSGFGPRTQLEVALRALFVLLHKKELSACGVCLDHHIYEKQPIATGGGNAFQDGSHGMINGGLGVPVEIPGLEGLSAEERNFADDVLNLPKRVAEATDANRASVKREYARISAAAPIMLDKAFGEGGHLNTDVECATRGFVGRVARECFDRVMAYTKRHLNDLLHITVHEGTEVTAVDIANPQRPVLHLQKDGKKSVRTFDFVTLAHGTTLRTPIGDDVAARSYTDIPNVDKIRSFLERFGLLEINSLFEARLKPQARIAIGGLSLSMLDMLLIVLRFTGIVVQDNKSERGYRIDEDQASKYKDLVLLFNREPGAFSGLRTKYDQAWEGAEPLLTPEEFHAAWMHDGKNVLLDLLELGCADVAASCGKTPDAINKPLSTEERAADYNRQIDAMLATQRSGKPNRTESALYRAMNQSVLNGQGLSDDPAAAEKTLEEKYPVSRGGTAGWPNQRAHLFVDSRLDNAIYTGNADLFKKWAEVQNSVASAPWVCLGITADLIERGVIRYQKASYEHIKPTENGLALGKAKFDALFAPKIIDVRADPVLAGLVNNVLSSHGQPLFTKGRFYRTKDGATTTHVCDIGLVGHGGKALDIHGKQTTVKAYWGDTNARLSALQRAPAGALIGLASALLRARGIDRPLDNVMDIHNRGQPSAEAYKNEMNRLRPHFAAFQEKLELLRLVSAVKEMTPELHAQYHQRLRTATGRKALREELASPLEELNDLALLRPDLKIKVNPIVDFCPLSLEQHKLRFIDFQPAEAEAVMAAVLEECTK